MKIIFDCLGFSGASAFVEKDGRQHQVGFITKICDKLKFDYFGLYERYLTKEEIPSPEQVIEEYDKQCKNKGRAYINEDIVYAG